MSHNPCSGHVFRASALVAATCLAAFAAPIARAGGAASACAATFRNARERAEAGRLREARELLLSCAKGKCGALGQQCAATYSQLGADVPTVVPVATDEAGAPRVDVAVSIDGEPLTPQLDGQALPVDPGLHEFAFATSSGVFSTQRVMILQGQRNRPITAVLKATEAPNRKERPLESQGAASAQAPGQGDPVEAPDKTLDKAAPSTAPVQGPRSARHGESSALAYVVGGAGLAAVGAGALLVYWGRQDNDLLSKCTPLCQPTSVEHVKTLYLAADVSLGVGVAALGVATWLFATSHAHEGKLTPRPSTYSLDLRPTRSGATLSVARAF
ncbi:MAG TPA: hypothetical protein VKU41_24740 [Polyangiaceae bacterium]|nr:hypothetical protein [Polyangiaceae bacterium]